MEGSTNTQTKLNETAASQGTSSGLEEKKAEKKPTQKNWDAIVKELVDDDEEADSADDLFKKIYANGTDEVRRAMIKSFTESGGTVLSTNWNQVSQGTTEVKPPEGCEFKKWT